MDGWMVKVMNERMGKRNIKYVYIGHIVLNYWQMYLRQMKSFCVVVVCRLMLACPLYPSAGTHWRSVITFSMHEDLVES